MERFITPEVNQFSKSQLTEERQKTANAVKEKRWQYFDRQESLSVQTERIIQEAKNSEANLTNVIDEIELISQQIDGRNNDIFRKFLKRFSVYDKKEKALKETLAEKLTTKKSFEQHFQQAQDLLEQINIDKNNKAELAEAKQTISDFYQDASEKWNEYLEEQEQVKIETVIEKYNVLIAHGIHPNFVPVGNSLLNLDINWQTKLKIVLALEPSLAASSIKENDSNRNMWARMGLIIRGGKVTKAYPQDLGTVATGIKKRHESGMLMSEKVSGQIEDAIIKRADGGYNELAVDDCKTAGFYFCIDQLENIVKNDLVDLDEIYQNCQELGLPLYVIKNGLLYESLYHPDLKKLEIQREQEIGEQLKGVYSPKQKQVIIKKAQQEAKESYARYIDSMLGRQVMPQEINNNQFQLTAEKKDIIKQELLTDPPFRCTFPEAECIKSKFFGEATYVEINAPTQKDNFLSQEINSQYFDKDCGIRPAPDEKIRKVAEIKEIGNKPVEYFISDKNILYRRKWWTRDRRFYLHQEDNLSNGDFNSSASINFEQFGMPITSNESYLKSMNDKIKEVTKNYQQAIDNGNSQKVIGLHRSRIDNLIYHLYGFGDKAKELNDSETAKATFEIANQYLPQETYREVIRRRLDDKGHFVTTEADFA